MYICSLWVSLALIFLTGSVQSQLLCNTDRDCNYFRCCRLSRTCADYGNGRACSCQQDSDCKVLYEQCRAGSCSFRYKQRTTTTKVNFPTWKPFTLYRPTWRRYHTLPPLGPVSPQCSTGSDCASGNGGGGFSWSGSRVLGIVLFVVLGTVVSCLYHLCRRARKPPVLAPRNGNVSAPPTGVAMRTIEHETTSTHVTVVEVEDDSPLPPDAPPPYNTLEFESRQNTDGDHPEQPPPSYDEAVRNPDIPPA